MCPIIVTRCELFQLSVTDRASYRHLTFWQLNRTANSGQKLAEICRHGRRKLGKKPLKNRHLSDRKSPRESISQICPRAPFFHLTEISELLDRLRLHRACRMRTLVDVAAFGKMGSQKTSDRFSQMTEASPELTFYFCGSRGKRSFATSAKPKLHAHESGLCKAVWG